MTTSTKIANSEVTNSDVYVFGNEHDLFMEDAISDWGKYNLRFLQHDYPDRLKEFEKIGSKLMNGADDERRLLYTLMTCSEYGRCNRSLCLLCEIEEEEKSAAAKETTKQSANAPQVQSAALTALLDRLKTGQSNVD